MGTAVPKPRLSVEIERHLTWRNIPGTTGIPRLCGIFRIWPEPAHNREVGSSSLPPAISRNPSGLRAPEHPEAESGGPRGDGAAPDDELGGVAVKGTSQGRLGRLRTDGDARAPGGQRAFHAQPRSCSMAA